MPHGIWSRCVIELRASRACRPARMPTPCSCLRSQDGGQHALWYSPVPPTRRVAATPPPLSRVLRLVPVYFSCPSKPWLFFLAPKQMNLLLVPQYSLSPLQLRHQGWGFCSLPCLCLSRRSLSGVYLFFCRSSLVRPQFFRRNCSPNRCRFGMSVEVRSALPMSPWWTRILPCAFYVKNWVHSFYSNYWLVSSYCHSANCWL